MRRHAEDAAEATVVGVEEEADKNVEYLETKTSKKHKKR